MNSDVLETPILRRTIAAGAALAAQRFVKADGTYPAAGGHALGVTYTEAADGERVAVTTLGIVPVETTAAAVAIDTRLKVDATGKVLAHSGADTVVGVALEAVPAAGGTILVHIVPN